MPGLKTTQLHPGALTGQRFALFTGRPPDASTRITQLSPAAGPARAYGDFTKAVVSTGGLTLNDILERIGGAQLYTLFDLSVTHPTPKTWKVSAVKVTDVPGEYRPLVRNHTGVSLSAGIGARGGGVGITLVIENEQGTGNGAGRKFMDQFAPGANVDGYAEPYDLNTMTLQVRLYSPLLPNQPFIIGQALAVQPSSVSLLHAAGEPEAVTLSFAQDERRYRQLPLNTITPERYPHAPDASNKQPIVPWFGTNLRVPTIPVDADGGLYVVGASPATNPMGTITLLWTSRPDPSSDSTDPVIYPVKLTSAGEVVLSIPGQTPTAKFVSFKQVAQRFELRPIGAFCYAVRLWLRRASAGSAAAGNISVTVHIDNDGLPGEKLVDSAATSEVNAAIVTTGVFAPYDIPFQGNDVARAAFLMGSKTLWIIAKFAKLAGGDLQIEVDENGTYPFGIMATQDTTTDDAWVLTGKQQRVGQVRQDFTGGGMLVRNVTTGVIKTKAPVTVPGL